MDHRKYLVWLYTNCYKNHFEKSCGGDVQQFCVSTLDQITNTESYGMENPSWRAVSFEETSKEKDKIRGASRHAEVAIAYKLPYMILEYYKTKQEFPKNIYLFSLNAPCLSCVNRLTTMMYFDHGLWIAVKAKLVGLEEDM